MIFEVKFTANPIANLHSTCPYIEPASVSVIVMKVHARNPLFWCRNLEQNCQDMYFRTAQLRKAGFQPLSAEQLVQLEAEAARLYPKDEGSQKVC